MARQLRTRKETRERNTVLRPGKVHRINSSPKRITGTARNLLRLTRLVSRTAARGANSLGSARRTGGKKGSPFQRRAIVNVRYSNAKTPGGWKAHGKYIERESARGTKPREHDGHLYSGRLPDIQDDRFGLARERTLDSLANEWQLAGDQRMFKIIISPEDAFVDFQNIAEGLIDRIQQYTGEPVEWAGVVHRNTDHPHAHLIVRGRLRSGETLRLPRHLIRSELREAVQTSITRQLGPRTFEDIRRQREGELSANRVTRIDRELAGRKTNRSYQPDKAYSVIALSGAQELQRLQHLQNLGLAKKLESEGWLLRTDVISQLRQMKDIQDRARTLFRAGVAISDPHAPMEYATSSKKLIGRVLLNGEDERTGALQTAFETTDGKVEIISHDGTLRAAWRRGDLEPGNIVTIDSLRSDPGRLYAAAVGSDKEILSNSKMLDLVARRMKTMGLVASESDKGWMGQFNNALRTRATERDRNVGF